MISRAIFPLLTIWVACVISLMVAAPLTAQTRFSSVLDGVGRPNAVKISYPVDPCGDLYAALSSRLAETELRFEKATLDTETFFLHFCNQKKDQWIAQVTEAVTGPVTSLQTQLNAAVDREIGELTGGFWKFVAEQLYPLLPPEAQARYAPGSPEMQAMAVEWLNNAPAEAQAYALAYFTSGEENAWVLSAWKTYVDLTNGQSAEIIAGLRGLATTAQTRVNQLLRAGEELDAAPPSTPTADVLSKVGLSGEWLDRFKSREGELRALNETYEIGRAVSVIYSAVGTEEPVSQVQAFFGLMRIGGEVAGKVGGPLTQFMGDIVLAYADAADQLLAATLALEQKINKRNGFCLGVGVPSRDPKATFFNDKGLLACPLKYGTWPFKHVYVTQGAQTPVYYFYNGQSFIEGTNATGRKGVLAAMELIDAGVEFGYPITRDPDGHVNRIGSVYNTSPPGGPIALLEEAREIVEEIEGGMDAIRTLVLPGDRCSLDQIVSSAAAAMGETPESLARPLAEGGERLAKVIAASFVAFEGGFGPAVRRGGAAMETYSDLAEKLGGLSVVILEGRVLDEDGRPVPGAILNVSVSNGEEVRGCEAWQADLSGRFSITALSTGRFPVVTASAEATAGRGSSETFRRGYVRRNALFYERRNGGITARTEIALTVPAEEADDPDPAEGEDTGGGATVGPTPDEPEPETPNPEVIAACAALERGLVETEAQLLSAGDMLFNRVSQRIDPHAEATGQGALCEPPLGNRLADLRNRVDEARRVTQLARDALQGCDPGALARATSEIAALSGVRLGALGDHVRQARTLVDTFETARSAYQSNQLEPAASGLRRVLDISRSANPPLCAAFADRAQRGLDQIATLEAFRARVDAAIAACDTPLMAQLSEASQGRDHPMFRDEIARMASARKQCDAADQEAAGARALCSALTVRLDSARADYRANQLGRADAKLAELRAALNGRAGQCDGMLSRVNAGLSNIAKLRTLEGQLSAAMSACDTGTMDRIETRARGEGHLWFQTALTRIASARRSCEAQASRPNVSDPCAELSRMEGYVATAADRGNWGEARDLLARAMSLASMPEALSDCPEQRSRVQGAVSAIATLQGAIADVDRAVASCSGDFDALAVRLDGISYNVAALDRARARLDAARRDCASVGQESVETRPAPAAAPTLVPGGNSLTFDGSWRGTGQISISAEGKTFPLPLEIRISVQNGVAGGDILTESGGMPVEGRVSGDTLMLEGFMSQDGVSVAVTYQVTLTGENSMSAQGTARMPDMACALSGIGEAIGGAIAGATSLGLIEEDEPEEPDCPTANYDSRWTATR
mgnify:CR=1 FL=1